jgi:transposase
VYPQIRAQAAAAGATIFFADEAGIRTDHHAGRTWAPVGRTPVVTATGARHRVNMVSAVSQRGEIHFEVLTENMNAQRFIDFSGKLLADAGTPVFLIVDGSRVHTAKKVTDYVASTDGKLQLFTLPPYAPELNPDEWVWKNVKHDQVKRAVPMNKQHLFELTVTALQRLQQSPHLVRGFYADPNLTYIHA